MSERMRTRVLVFGGADALMLGFHCYNVIGIRRSLERLGLNEAFATVDLAALFQPFVPPAPLPEWNAAQVRQANRSIQARLRERSHAFRSHDLARARRLPRPNRLRSK